MVEIALGETPQNAARIARESLEQNLLFHADYERFARNSFSWVLTRLEPMEVPDGALISGIVRRHRGGVIYATAHVGCYLAALMRIGQFLKPAGPVAVIKREGANAREALAYRHFEALGIELQLLRAGHVLPPWPFVPSSGAAAWCSCMTCTKDLASGIAARARSSIAQRRSRRGRPRWPPEPAP